MKRPDSYTAAVAAAAVEEEERGRAAAVAAVRASRGRAPGAGKATPAAKARQARARRRERISLELTAELVPILREVAEGLGTSPAGVADVLLVEGLRAWLAGRVDFDTYAQPSRSPRYEFRVEVEIDGLAGQATARLAELMREE